MIITCEKISLRTAINNCYGTLLLTIPEVLQNHVLTINMNVVKLSWQIIIADCLSRKTLNMANEGIKRY